MVSKQFLLVVLAASSLIATQALCATQALGDERINLRVQGDRREYLVHLPPCYDGCTSLPVILAFHGMSANGKLLQRLTKLDETADKFGYITVYPEGTGLGPLKGFKAGATARKREQRKPDDVRFVHAILDDLQQRFRVDASRVYATGLSNGAMMCYRLAVEMPNRIAAIAPISGALGTEVCLPSCPISVMHFHGTCDEVLPFHGPKEGGLFPQSYHAAPRTIQLFASAAQCNAAPDVESLPNTADDGTQVCIHSYVDCAPGVEVMLVQITGGGHQWPMHRIPLRYLGNTTQEIDANEMMCCFFQRHALACGF